MPINTKKFSEFFNSGNLKKNKTTVGLDGVVNAQFNNPWVFLPPGSTANRPPITADMYYELRLNTDSGEYEYYNPVLADWVTLSNNAFDNSPYIIYTDDPALPNAFDLGTLSNGLLKLSVLAGVATPQNATVGIDYFGPGQPNPIPIIYGGTDANNASDARTNLGLGTMATQDANNVAITGGSAQLGAGSVAAVPVNPNDLVNKAYADAIGGGFTFKNACYAATTATLNATYNNGLSGVGATLTSNVNGVFTIDGVSPALNARVLVKDMSNAAYNGIYTVTDAGSVSTPYIITRSTDFDTSAEIQPGSIVFVTDGATQADRSWVCTDAVLTVGTDPINFVAFSQAYPLSLANGGTGASLTATNNALVVGTSTAMAFMTMANNGVLVTNGSGVPSISTTLPSGLTIPGYATSGANANITSMTGLTGQLRAPTAIASSAGLPVLSFFYTPSAVNNLQLASSATGQPVQLGVMGSDTDINVTLSTKGTGVWSFLSANTAVPFQILSGTAFQHTTRFLMPNTAANRVVTFQDASGTMAYLADRGWVYLGSATPTGVATAEFTNLTGYTQYCLVFQGVSPVTNAVNLAFQVSINNGASYLTGASDYAYQGALFNNTTASFSAALLAYVPVSSLNTNLAGGGSTGMLYINNVLSTTQRKGVLSSCSYYQSAGPINSYQVFAQPQTTSVINAIRLAFSTGDIASGTLFLYGIK